MAPRPLDTLPLLILETISLHLASQTDHLSALLSFSLASKTCSAATSIQRFKKIRLRISTVENLHNDIQTISAILSKYGHGILHNLAIGEKIEGNSAFNSDSDDEEDGEEKLLILGSKGRNVRIANDTEMNLDETEVWSPLVRFIETLPALRDLAWLLRDQIPTCLVRMLQHAPAGLRLHVWNMKFPSLAQDRDELVSVTEDYALATLPCLYRISMVFWRYPRSGRVVVDQEALLAMIGGLTPGLRAVEMSLPRPGWSSPIIGEESWAQEEVRNLRAMQLVKSKENKRIQLHRLRLWAGDCFSELEQVTDFAELRRLDIRCEMRANDLQRLIDLAQAQELRNLQALSLNLSKSYDRLEHLDRRAERLLCYLLPLRKLWLNGCCAQRCFEATISIHGTSLRKLAFRPGLDSDEGSEIFMLTADHIQRLAEHCPNLEVLDLNICRSGGDEQETRIYEAMNGLKRLKRIVLTLDCDLAIPNDRDDAVDAETFKRNVLRDRFRNVAMDRSLAISIAEAMSVGRKSLLSVKLCMSAHSIIAEQVYVYFLDPAFEALMQWLGRSWNCVPDPCDRMRYIAHEIEEGKRIEAQERELGDDFGKAWVDDEGGKIEVQVAELGDGFEEAKEQAMYREVWDDLWPQRDGECWRDSWSSLPLWAEA